MKIKSLTFLCIMVFSFSALAESIKINRVSNVYTKPTASSTKLHKAEPGDKFELNKINKVNGYYEIKFDSVIAYVFGARSSIIAVPAISESETFKIISWNVQTFGNLNATRQALYHTVSPQVFTDNVGVLAFQEVANNQGVGILNDILPGDDDQWQFSFRNSNSAQDNGITVNINHGKIIDQGFLFANIPDPTKSAKADEACAVHPVRWAYIKVGNFDFTILSLHLTFAGGNAERSKTELLKVLDWVDNYLEQPGADPDVIICGDFNLPTIEGKPLSNRSGDNKWMTIESIITKHGKFASGANAMTVYVNDRTSRSSKAPANNYDHFILTKDLVNEEFVNASRFDVEVIHEVDVDSDQSLSDHYPIQALFKSSGAGIALDSN